MTQAPKLPKERHGRHLLTVVVEDYFHATALNRLIPSRHWHRLESRVRTNTMRALELLDQHDQRGTFFVLGWVADQMPDLVRTIYEAGHEVASKGYSHRPLAELSPAQFRKEVALAKSALEAALGRRILGFRVPQDSVDLGQLWALEILAEEGYLYDSSMYPRLRAIAAEPWRRFPHVHQAQDGRSIVELPLSTLGTDLLLLPAAGGNYFRQLPTVLTRGAFAFWHRRYTSPFNMYFHVWELDQDLPRISTASWSTRVRQYRNLEKMPQLIRWYLSRYRFESIARYLSLTQPRLKSGVTAHARAPSVGTPPAAPERSDKAPVTIVVPCFNEEAVLAFLAATLKDLETRLSTRYSLSYIFVDDASTDQTWRVLKEHFQQRKDCVLIRHPKNQGVARAILTGIRAAKTEVVCSIDCDCTYDPSQLELMLPKLLPGVVMVTASPYHPEGHVVGVPEWRLVLSKTLSRMYRLMLNSQLATYTSCFRVYRRSVVENLPLDHGDFLGVAEMLVRLDFAGSLIVECPATLESRLLGASKMKTLKTIRGHLGLISNFSRLRRDPMVSLKT